MAYRLNCEGLVIQIANRSTCNGNAPNVVIRMESNGVILYLGKHPLQLRIYDKVAQLVMANDPLKLMLIKDQSDDGTGNDGTRQHESNLRLDFRTGPDVQCANHWKHWIGEASM